MPLNAPPGEACRTAFTITRFFVEGEIDSCQDEAMRVP